MFKSNSPKNEELDRVAKLVLKAAGASESDIEAAASSPFLFTRIRASINEGAEPEDSRGWLSVIQVAWRAVPAMALVAIMAAGLTVWSTSNAPVPVAQADDEPLIGALDPGVASLTAPRARDQAGEDMRGDARQVWKTMTELGWMGLGLGPTMILVRPRAWLTLTLGYLGQFGEAISLGEESIWIAESGGHEFDCIIATNTLGSVYVIKGDFERAIPLLERSLALARTWSRVGWSTAGFLGLAYAQSGRCDEALQLFQEALETSREAVGDVRSSRFRQLGEIHLRAGHPAEALEHARQALDLARDRKQRGFEALALRLLGEVASHPDRFEPGNAEQYARQALSLADELGMRPLGAQCRLDLGTLWCRTDRAVDGQEHLTTAAAMFRDMGMTRWFEKSSIPSS